MSLETKLQPFLKKPFFFLWPAVRFKPSDYDAVFNLCANSLIESFGQMKVKNFEVGYRPGEPSAEFYHAMDMLEHLLKSIHHAPRFPWKAPGLWLSAGILYFLFTDPYGPLFWWLVLVETILMIFTVVGRTV